MNFLKHENMEDISESKNLKYLNAVVKECVRIYPPIAMLVPRTCAKDTVLGDVFVPKGTTIQINAWRIHHDPRFYVDPEVFMPERFIDREKSKSSKSNYFGFSGGPRTCPGKNFSYFEMMIFLVRLMDKYDVVIPEDSKLQFMKGSILLIPDENLKVQYRLRKK